MKYIVLVVLLVFLLLFIFFYPFKITLYNKDNYIHINISNFITLKMNLLVLLDSNHNEDIKKQAKGVKIINKVKFKEIDLRLQGLNFDYRLNGGYFGMLFALFGFLKILCEMNEINFNYDLKYQGDKSIEFKSIFRARVSKVLTTFYSN